MIVLVDMTSGLILKLDPVKAAAGEYDEQIHLLALRAARSGQLAARSGQTVDSAGFLTDDALVVGGYREAARRLGISERSLRRRVASGAIGYHRDGRRVIFTTENLETYREATRV